MHVLQPTAVQPTGQLYLNVLRPDHLLLLHCCGLLRSRLRRWLLARWRHNLRSRFRGILHRRLCQQVRNSSSGRSGGSSDGRFGVRSEPGGRRFAVQQVQLLARLLARLLADDARRPSAGSLGGVGTVLQRALGPISEASGLAAACSAACIAAGCTLSLVASED
jgi:hypothetical protein